MKITKKRKELVNLYYMMTYLGDLRGAKFTYSISKNKEVLKKELDNIQEIAKLPEETLAKYKEYNTKKTELSEKHALKDKDGNPIKKNNEYQIKNKTTFTKDLEALKKEYKKVIEEVDKRKAEVDKLGEEEITLELKTLPIGIIPNEITVDQMDVLSMLITE